MCRHRAIGGNRGRIKEGSHACGRSRLCGNDFKQQAGVLTRQFVHVAFDKRVVAGFHEHYSHRAVATDSSHIIFQTDDFGWQKKGHKSALGDLKLKLV